MSQKRGFCLQQCAADQQAGPEHKRRCKAMTATQSQFIGDSGVINRVEYIRILQQALTELGYSQLADGLAEASNCLCEAPSVVHLRQHIVNGAWLPACEAAEACTELTTDQLSRVKYVLMQQHVLEVCDRHMYFTPFLSMSTAHASPAWFSMCTGPSAPSRVHAVLSQPHLVQSIASKQYTTALQCIRTKMQPLGVCRAELHELTGCLVCENAAELMSTFSWDGPTAKGRHTALQAVQVWSRSMVLCAAAVAKHLPCTDAIAAGLTVGHKRVYGPAAHIKPYIRTASDMHGRANFVPDETLQHAGYRACKRHDSSWEIAQPD